MNWKLAICAAWFIFAIGGCTWICYVATIAPVEKKRRTKSGSGANGGFR